MTPLPAMLMLWAAVVPATAAEVAQDVPVEAREPAQPQLPAEVTQLIRAAMAGGDEAAVASIARYARAAFPAAQVEIQSLTDEFARSMAQRREAAAAERRQQLASASILEHWTGQVELGASRTTGQTSSLGFYGAFEAKREGLNWNHVFNGRAEFQETNGVRSIDRITAAWAPRYRLGDDLNLYGLAQFERDPLLRIDQRYTASGGLGFTLVDESDMSLRLDGGPAVRRTRTTDGLATTALGGRASLDFDWKITPTLELKQDSSFILDGGNQSGRATTAVETRLFGPVRARLSYELLYERDSILGTDSFGTSGRTTLVVGL